MMTTDVRKNYEAFLEKRNALISLTDRQIALLSALNINTRIEALQKLKQRVSTDAFKILIVGEFKRGKSTFINAMLGQEILPAYATPCTAVINEVKWGELPQALVHYSTSGEGAKRETELISVEAIEEYVVIPENLANDYVNPYEKVEIFYPLELCRSGVEVIDSPGLNEHITRSQVTESYLPIVDAIVFVFTCEALASESEISFIENRLKPLGHEDLFFVCNKFDQIREKEKERVRRFAISKLAPLSKRGEKGVFFVSAFQGLEGRLNGDQEKVDKSGISILEQELERFLTTDRGRLKILEPAKDLQESIKIARQSVPEQQAMLHLDRNELEQRYVAAQKPLELLQTKREQIVTRVSQFCEDVTKLVSDKAYTFYNQLPLKVEEWVQEYEFKSQVNFAKLNPVQAKSQLKPLIKELYDHLVSKLEDEFVSWQISEVSPFLSSRSEVLKQDIDARAAEFIREVDELRAQLASDSASTLTKQAVSGIVRLFNAAGQSSQVGGAWIAGVMGIGSRTAFKYVGGTALLYSVLLGAAFAGVFLEAIIPVIGPMILLFTAATLPNEVKRAKQNIEIKIKQTMSQKFSEEVRKSSKEQSIEFANGISKELTEIQDVVDQGLAKEIQSIRDQVKAVLEEKNKGQASVDQRIRELSIISDNLDKLNAELDDLINQLNFL